MNQKKNENPHDAEQTAYENEARAWLKRVAQILAEDPAAVERLLALKRIFEQSAGGTVTDHVGLSKPQSGDRGETDRAEKPTNQVGRPRARSRTEVLNAIRLCTIENGHSPTLDELRDFLKIGSRRTVQRYLDDLARHGLVKRERGVLQIRQTNGAKEPKS